MSKIRKRSLVSIDPVFIRNYNRSDLTDNELWRVIQIDPICNGHIAHLSNYRTGEKITLPIGFLLLKVPT